MTQHDYRLDPIEQRGRRFAGQRSQVQIGGAPKERLDYVDYNLFDNGQGAGQQFQGGAGGQQYVGRGGNRGLRRPGGAPQAEYMGRWKQGDPKWWEGHNLNDPLAASSARPGYTGQGFDDPSTLPDWGYLPPGRGQEETVKKKYGSGDIGMAKYFDDSYYRLLQGQANGLTSSELNTDVLRNFRGSVSDLKDFMESPAYRQAMVYGVENTEGFQRSQDFSGYDEMFAAGAGDIASGAAEAQSMGTRMAARSGQGRNAALRASLAGQASQGAAQKTATLRGQVQMQRLQQAQRAFEQQRQLAALATGQVMPRTQKEGDSSEVADYAQAVGSIAGAFV